MDNTTQSQQKRIRSMPPDVTVVVGTGDNQQEFECYKVVLSFASPYLDAMLSNDMVENNNSRIEFPDKDPDEWKIVYGYMIARDMDIVKENAQMLAPWFNYFQMTKQLDECDNLLKEKATRMVNDKVNSRKIKEELWHKTGKSESQLIEVERKETFGKIIELFHLSYIHNLNWTRLFIDDFIARSMSTDTNFHNNFVEMQDLFDMPVVNTLVELALPFDKDDIHYGADAYEGIYKPVFYFDDEFECRNELQKLSLDEINKNKDMLAWIISSHMERRLNKLLRGDIESLKSDKASLERNMIILGYEPDARLAQVEDTWVGCSTCGKWRMLPPDISAEEVEALPDVWTCADNIWDPARSNCNAEERTAMWMFRYYERRRQEEEDD